MLIFKFLHIVSMFAAVTLLVGGSISFALIAHRRDPQLIVRFSPILSRIEGTGVVVAIAGVVFGVLTALTGGFDLLDGWLIVAYAITITLFILGPIESVFAGRVITAAEASPDTPSPELKAQLADRRGDFLAIVSTVLYVLIIADMVFKPF